MPTGRSRRQQPHAKPLRGAGVVVTRPAGTGTALALRVRGRGGRPVLLPGLALRPAADAAAASRALSAGAGVDIWIFSSPAAVRFAFRLLPTLRISSRAAVFGLGAGTRRALARHRIDAAAPGGAGDSESLLALAPLRRVRGLRIAVVGAPGGRGMIAATLRRRRAQVEEVAVYRRTAPRLTRRHFAALARAPSPLFTLLSSGEALANLVAVLPRTMLARLRRNVLVVSSARLAAQARGHGFGRIVEAASAAPDDLLEAVATALARHGS